MSFLGSLFTGDNPTLSANIPKFGAEAGFAQNIGEGDTTAASKWYNDILSGDPTRMAQAVAPETAATQEQTQQAKNTAAQFGNRSGGTAATLAGLDANTRAQIIKLLGGLQSGAASGAANLGTTEQGIALTGQQAQDAAAMQQQQLQQQSILGGLISGGVGSLASLGLGGILGMGGGGGGSNLATLQSQANLPMDLTGGGV